MSAGHGVVAIACGDWHTVAVPNDGTALATGNNRRGQTDIDRWSDLTDIAAGYLHTVGLRGDGIVAAGESGQGQCDVTQWSRITSVAAGSHHTLALREDGTVNAVGDNHFGQRDVQDRTDVTAIAAGSTHSLGLLVDGSVVAAGNDAHRQCDVSTWQLRRRWPETRPALSPQLGHTLNLNSTTFRWS